MRPEILQIIERLYDALEASPADRVSLARRDVERLASWARAAEMREINACTKGMQEAMSIMVREIPDRPNRDQAMYECCRTQCLRLVRIVGDRQRSWTRDSAGRYREARLREDDRRWRRTR